MKRIALSMMLVLLSLGLFAAPRQLVLLTAFSVHDAQIGPAADAAQKRMDRDFRAIADVLGLEFKAVNFEPDQMTGPQVSATIKNLPQGDDVIIVNAWLAHGLNARDYTPDKTGYIGLGDRSLVRFYDIHSMLVARPHHLVISSVESCQGIQGSTRDQLNVVTLDAKAIYKRLFIESKGDLLLSSASPGEFSWVETNVGWAPLHDNLLRAIKATDAGVASLGETWGEVLAETVTGCKRDVSNMGHAQSPHYLMNIVQDGERQEQPTPPELDASQFLKGN